MRYKSLGERFFIHKIKPSLLISDQYEVFDEAINKYPYINKEEFPALNDQYLFFQTEDLKRMLCDKYLVNADQIKKSSEEYHRVLGGLLQIPDHAIDFFVSEDRNNMDISATIRYYGLNYIVHIKDIPESIYYLWDLMPYPDDDKVLVTFRNDPFSFLEVEFGDYDHVTAIKSQLHTLVGSGTQNCVE